VAGARAGGITAAVVDDLAYLQYHQGGWFVADAVFSDDECDWLAAELDSVEPRLAHDEPSDGQMAYRPMAHTRSAALQAAATDRRWGPIVEPLVGPDVRLVWDQGVDKPPGTGTNAPWHQDAEYLPLVPEQYLVCWVALDDASTDNGCLWVLPGSHQQGRYRHRTDDEGQFRIGYEGDDAGIPVPAARGSVVVHSSLLLHRSGPNRSDRHRRTWVLQFCPAGARSNLSGRPLDDRLQVAQGGRWLEHSSAERPFDLASVHGTHDRR